MNERQRKHHYSQPTKRKSKLRSNSEQKSKRQKTGLSEEAKRQFEANLKQEYEQEQKQRKEQSSQAALDLKRQHEEQCETIFSGKLGKKLSYRTVPWPHKPGGSVQDVEQFLFIGLTKGSEEYKKHLKTQRIRWHPDRFVQKVGQHLKDTDREKILEKVNQISQLLNSISE